jgi:hypothetical protein
VVLDSSGLVHDPGSDDYRLRLGAIAAGAGYTFPAQQTILQWDEDKLGIDRFDLTPRLGVRGVALNIPASGNLSAAGTAIIDDSRLIVGGDLSAATIRLEGAPLVIQEALKNVALELPVNVTIQSLDAKLEDFQKPLDQWQATVKADLREIHFQDLRIASVTLDASKASSTAANLWNANAKSEITGVTYQDWSAERLSLDAAKDGDQATLGWSAAALSSGISGQTGLHWRSLPAGNWNDFEADTTASVPQLSALFAELKKRFAFAPPEAPPLPESSLTLDAKVDMAPSGIRSADARWKLLPQDPGIPSLAGRDKWTPDGKLDGSLETEALRATYALDLKAKRYQATANLDRFHPDRLSPWADATGVKLPTGMLAEATWQGSGAFGASPHTGTFDIPSFEWTRPDAPPLAVHAKGSYDWPREATITEATATTQGQTISLEAKFAGRVLKIPRLEWKEGENKLITGQAEIPVPENPSSVKDFLRQTENISVFLESEWIDASRLAPWMPEKKSPLAAGSGRVHLILAGTPAKPKIELDAALKGLQLANQPDVPVTDAKLKIDGVDETLDLAGEIRPASYPPVTLSGKMPFRPGAWADDPKAALDEKFEARANIPKLDLGTFKKFVPGADHLAGFLEGNFSAAGRLGKPELAGKVRLSDGALTLKDSKVPPVAKVNAAVDLEGKTVRLSSLSLESAGGTLTGSGKVDLTDSSKPAFDLNLKGDALPISRDDSMIVRADANLSLQGTLENAKISGKVEVVDSLYYRDFEILPVRVPFTAPSRPKLPAIDAGKKSAAIPEPYNHWALDVKVSTRDPLLIRGNLADGSATADVRFGGTLGNIQPQGNAFIREATASLPFSRLKVSNGVVVFTPANGLNPELNIRGTSTIGRYEVNVFFYGPLNDPKTALTSDPPLAESEIMTLLATGTTSDGLAGGQAATLKAAQLLVEEWRKGRLPFGEQVAKLVAVLNKVDLRIGEDDPLSGKRLNSATIELSERWYASGSVDKESNTRVLGAFVLRFK